MKKLSDFVDFRQAQMLKSLGFDEPVTAYYSPNGELVKHRRVFESKRTVVFDESDILWNDNKKDDIYSAPMLSDAIDWVAQKIGLVIVPYVRFLKNENDSWFGYGIHDIMKGYEIIDLDIDAISAGYSNNPVDSMSVGLGVALETAIKKEERDIKIKESYSIEKDNQADNILCFSLKEYYPDMSENMEHIDPMKISSERYKLMDEMFDKMFSFKKPEENE